MHCARRGGDYGFAIALSNELRRNAHGNVLVYQWIGAVLAGACIFVFAFKIVIWHF